MTENILMEVIGRRIRMGSVNKYLIIYDKKIEIYNNKKSNEYLLYSLCYNEISKIEAKIGFLSGGLVIRCVNYPKIVIQNIDKKVTLIAKQIIEEKLQN